MVTGDNVGSPLYTISLSMLVKNSFIAINTDKEIAIRNKVKRRKAKKNSWFLFNCIFVVARKSNSTLKYKYIS